MTEHPDAYSIPGRGSDGPDYHGQDMTDIYLSDEEIFVVVKHCHANGPVTAMEIYRAIAKEQADHTAKVDEVAYQDLDIAFEEMRGPYEATLAEIAGLKARLEMFIAIHASVCRTP